MKSRPFKVVALVVTMLFASTIGSVSIATASDTTDSSGIAVEQSPAAPQSQAPSESVPEVPSDEASDEASGGASENPAGEAQDSYDTCLPAATHLDSPPNETSGLAASPDDQCRQSQENDAQEDQAQEVEARQEMDSATLTQALQGDISALEMPVLPFESASSGGVTVNIPEYSSTPGVHFLHSLQTNVVVDFTDVNVTDKTVVITLAPGMRFAGYPVNDAPHNIQVPANDVLSSLITSYTAPTVSFWHTYVGSLTYHFSDATTSVSIPLIIAPDEIAYYGPLTITNGISVQGLENDGSVQSLGVANMNINIYGEASFGQGNTADGWGGIEMSLTDSVTLGQNCWTSSELYQRGHYFKSITYEYYYPAGFNYVSTNHAEWLITNDTVNRKLSFTAPERSSNTCEPITIVIQVNASSPPTLGVQVAAASPSTIYFTNYDDTVTVAYPSSTMSIKVVDPSTIPNRPAYVAAHSSKPYYGYGDGYLQWIAGLQIANDYVTVKTEQWVTASFSSEIFASYVAMPFDSAANAAAPETWYQTTANPGTWVQAAANQIIRGEFYYSDAAAISQTSLGLPLSVGITEVKMKIGNINKKFTSSPGMHTPLRTPGVIGKLTDSNDSGVAAFSSFASSDYGPNPTPAVGTQIDCQGIVIRTAKPSVSVRGQVPALTINAGETKTQSVSLNSIYSYGSGQAMLNPTIYVRIPDGIVYSNPQISDTSGFASSAIMSAPYITNSGARFVKIETQSHYGAYWNNNQVSNIYLTFNVTALQNVTSGVFNWTNFIFLKDDISTLVQEFNGNPPLVSNIWDVDNDFNTSAKLTTFASQPYIVNAADSLNIDTYLLSSEGIREPSFDSATPENAVHFSPQSNVHYKLDINNRSNYPATNIVSYLPIPKTGLNFGASFQLESFNWDMELSGSVSLTVKNSSGDDISASKVGDYTIECAAITYGNESNYASASYSSTCDSSTSMLRIVNNTGIDSHNIAHFSVPFTIAEDSTSLATSPEKLESLNIFNPYYSFLSNGNGANMQGTTVGVRLVNGEIGGKVFLDGNHNGLLDGGETLLENANVILYKKGAGDTYSAVNTVTTGVGAQAGVYKFDGLQSGVYYVDFNSVLSGTYADGYKFTKDNVGSDYRLSSWPAFDGTNLGHALNINPVDIEADFVNAGIAIYATPTVSVAITRSLKVANEVKSAEKYYLSGIATPSYFSQIADPVTPRVYSTSDASVATVSWNGIITAVSPGTATVTLTITDMYGGVATATCTVTVLSNDIPVLSGGADIALKIGEDSLPTPSWTGIEVTDTEDTSSSATAYADYLSTFPSAVTSITADAIPTDPITGFVTTPGVYDIIYALKDSDGNTALLTRHIYVTQPPYTWVLQANDIQLHTSELDGLDDDALKEAASLKIIDVADPGNPVEVSLSDVNAHAEVTPNIATLEHVTQIPWALGTHTLRFELVKNTSARARIVMASGEFSALVYGDAITPPTPPTPPALCQDPANAGLPECQAAPGQSGYCSDPVHFDEAACVAAGATWTPASPGESLASTGVSSPFPVLISLLLTLAFSFRLLRKLPKTP